MKSRYDFMKEGVVKDEGSNNYYPDPLSMNYLDFRNSSIPQSEKMSDEEIMFFWLEVTKYYGGAFYDDIVLTLNGYPHINHLKNGDIIYFPSQMDIDKSFNKGVY